MNRFLIIDINLTPRPSHPFQALIITVKSVTDPVVWFYRTNTERLNNGPKSVRFSAHDYPSTLGSGLLQLHASSLRSVIRDRKWNLMRQTCSLVAEETFLFALSCFHIFFLSFPSCPLCPGFIFSLCVRLCCRETTFGVRS